MFAHKFLHGVCMEESRHASTLRPQSAHMYANDDCGTLNAWYWSRVVSAAHSTPYRLCMRTTLWMRWCVPRAWWSVRQSDSNRSFKSRWWWWRRRRRVFYAKTCASKSYICDDLPRVVACFWNLTILFSFFPFFRASWTEYGSVRSGLIWRVIR